MNPSISSITAPASRAQPSEVPGRSRGHFRGSSEFGERALRSAATIRCPRELVVGGAAGNRALGLDPRIAAGLRLEARLRSASRERSLVSAPACQPLPSPTLRRAHGGSPRSVRTEPPPHVAGLESATRRARADLREGASPELAAGGSGQESPRRSLRGPVTCENGAPSGTRTPNPVDESHGLPCDARWAFLLVSDGARGTRSSFVEPGAGPWRDVSGTQIGPRT
jgi:hypothetical protein